MAGFTDARQTWDGRYAKADGFLFGEAPNEWLVASAHHLRPGARVLSLADGEGRNGVWLAQQGMQVTAFDISAVGIDRARGYAQRVGVQVDLRVSEIAQWAWEPGAYDAVVAIFIQFAPPALRAAIFAGIARTLVPGGLLILEGYGPRQLSYRTGGPGIAENLYTMSMLAQAFDGWHILASRDVDREIREGSGHSGMSHLVSLVLRKPDGISPSGTPPRDA
jgi:SAM-dependent methyltransferase